MRHLRNGSLLISNTTFDDDGLYRCVATNKAGQDSQNITLLSTLERETQCMNFKINFGPDRLCCVGSSVASFPGPVRNVGMGPGNEAISSVGRTLGLKADGGGFTG